MGDMIQYFIDQNGQVFSKNVANYKELAELRKNYRMASPRERLAFVKNEDDREKNFAKNHNLKDVFFMAPTKNKDGYGNTAVNMKRRAIKHGYHFNTIHTDQKVGLCYHLPNTLSLVKTPIQISYTMFESDQYPPFWEPYLKRADHVVVPTGFCAEIMERNFGVVPEIIPLGYDPDFFYYLDRQNRPSDHKFTFLHYDAFKFRKGWDIVFKAFNDEFGEVDGDDVRLIFKTTLGVSPNFDQYPKVTKIMGQLDQDDMHKILAQADCFVFPTRGEGFGLTPLEAMATGMRAIVPNHTGVATYFDKRYCVDLETEEVIAKYDNTELRQLNLGKQWQPTVESVRKAMRAEFEAWKARGNKLDEAHSKEVSAYASQFSIEQTTIKVCKMLDRYTN